MLTSRRRLEITGGLAAGLLVAILIPVLSGHTGPTTANQKQQVLPGMFGPDQPLGPNGQPTSMSSAAAQSPFPVYRPQDGLASDSSVAGVWIRTSDLPEVFIRYTSGIEVSDRVPDLSGGFVNHFQSDINSGSSGQLTTIDGVTTYLVPGDNSSGAGGADLVLNGTLVEIVAPGFTAQQISDMVQSIVETQKQAQAATSSS